MEVIEKTIFVPPRKRGSKSSSKSSSENLQMSGVGPNTPPQSCNHIDHCTNRKLHYQAISSDQVKDCLGIKYQSNSTVHNLNSSGRRLNTYQNQIYKPTNGKNEESDLNSDDLTSADYVNINDGYAEIELSTEKCALNSCSVSSIGSCAGNFVTMTGTVKRGRKKGQTMDMKVQMSREELDELEQSIRSQQIDDDDRCFFGLRKGPHIFTFSLTLVPFVFVLSAAYSFYIGTMTWYNVLVYFSEKKTIFHKIFMSPLLIISYPFLITLSTIGLGIYAAIVQVSWHVDNWRREVQDWEKGFYGWLCGVLNLEDCSPYEVVILTEVLPPVEEVKQQKVQVADTAL